MFDQIYSSVAGLIVGCVYAFLFLKGFDLHTGSLSTSHFQQGLTFMARFIFIIVAILAVTIYLKVNLFWFLLSLGVSFWGFVLVKLRVK